MKFNTFWFCIFTSSYIYFRIISFTQCFQLSAMCWYLSDQYLQSWMLYIVISNCLLHIPQVPQILWVPRSTFMLSLYHHLQSLFLFLYSFSQLMASPSTVKLQVTELLIYSISQFIHYWSPNSASFTLWFFFLHLSCLNNFLKTQNLYRIFLEFSPFSVTNLFLYQSKLYSTTIAVLWKTKSAENPLLDIWL